MVSPNKYFSILIGIFVTLSIVGTHNTQAEEIDPNKT
jgi:hypothetical protein